MQKTSNLGLNKPEGTDVVNIEDLNANADILDAKLGTSGHSHDGTPGNGPKIAYSNITGTPTAFGNVKVGSTTIQADSKSDTLEIVNGANITVTPDATNDRLTIAVTGTVPSATTAATCTGNAATATTAKTCTGNAATATKLAAARTIALTGDVTGSATFDGSGNATINATANNNILSLIPHYTLKHNSAITYTQPSDFETYDPVSSLVSFGGIILTLGTSEYLGSSCILFEMKINTSVANTVTQKVRYVDNCVYFYLNNSLVGSITAGLTVNKDITWNLAKGENLIQIVARNVGGAMGLVIYGDIINENNSFGGYIPS